MAVWAQALGLLCKLPQSSGGVILEDQGERFPLISSRRQWTLFFFSF